MHWTALGLGILLLSACGPTPPTGSDYSIHCTSVLVRIANQDPAWRGSKPVITDPKIIDPGPPVVVRCLAELRTGRFVTYDITARCRDGLEEHCSVAR